MTLARSRYGVLKITVIYEKLMFAYIFEGIIAFVPIIYGKVTDRDLRSYGLKITKKLFLLGTGLSIVIGICLSFISSPVSLTFRWVFLSLLLAPICEEFFFRGFVQTHLMEKLSGGKTLLNFYFSHGLVIAALIFGSFHLSDAFLLNLSWASAVINATFATLFGLLLGYVYQETRSILTPILMHGCLNGLPLILIL